MSLFELVLLVISFVIIVVAAALFTNGIEILGERLNLGQGAVGSVLAAVGTALPETMIPVVAIIGALLTGRDPASAGDIGTGAILGAPFLLATLAMFVVGISALAFKGRRESGTSLRLEEDEATVRRDVSFFLVLFAVAGGAGIVPLPYVVMVILGVLLVAAFVVHVLMTLRSGSSSEEAPEKLRLWPYASPAPTWAVAGQVILALALIVGGAHFFVESLKSISSEVGVPAGLIALILAPLATELPEKLNSVIWVRDDKDTLAMGNITGAMVFQSTIPVLIGMLFTSWDLKPLDILSVALALVSGGIVFLFLMRKAPVRASQLLIGGGFYAAFVVAALLVIFL